MFISDTMVHIHLTWYNNGTIAHYYYPKLRIYTSKEPKHGHIQSYSVQRFMADCRCIHFCYKSIYATSTVKYRSTSYTIVNRKLQVFGQ